MRWLIFISLFGLFICGCGSDQVPTYPVSGRVQFSDGEPVRLGTIELESVEHLTSATGTINEDGTFVLGTYTSTDGAAAGNHRAIVVQVIVNDGLFKHVKDHGRPVPPHFADYDSSLLSVEVLAQPKNDIVVTLPRKSATN